MFTQRRRRIARLNTLHLCYFVGCGTPFCTSPLPLTTEHDWALVEATGCFPAPLELPFWRMRWVGGSVGVDRTVGGVYLSSESELIPSYYSRQRLQIRAPTTCFTQKLGIRASPFSSTHQKLGIRAYLLSSESELIHTIPESELLRSPATTKSSESEPI